MSRSLASFFIASLLALTRIIHADEPLVFISAFASGEKSAIHAFQFDNVTGALHPLQRTTDLQNPFFLALSPDHRFLYSVDSEKFGGNKEAFVAAYAIESRTGQLRRLNRQSSHGTAPCYLDVDATGRTLVVANYSSGTVAALPVQSDGSLGEAASFFQHSEPGVAAENQKKPHAHSIVISPDQRFALAADLGLDRIITYRLDPTSAKMTTEGTPSPTAVTSGTGPRHLRFHPNGKWVYAINETKNSVTLFEYTTETGALAEQQTISTLPADFTAKSNCADLKITPDGRFLYGTNRGHNSIAIFRIAEDGKLTLIGCQPSLGQGPQNLLLTPDGQWLLCANMPGNSVTVFAIDKPTGSLKPVGEPIALPSPSCITYLP
jgi:6-phosphogluconolactonase